MIPTKDLKAHVTMAVWADAFTANMEAIAMSHANARLKAELKDAEKQVASDFKDAQEGARGLFRSDEARRAADEAEQAAFKNLENQQGMAQHLHGFDFEAYKHILSIWKRVRAQILSTGWDLTEDIQGTRTPNGIRFRQGKDRLDLPFADADVFLHFLKFVGDQSQQDPVEYVKRVLTAQGVTAENFAEKCGGTGIANPWAASGLVTPSTPRIIAP